MILEDLDLKPIAPAVKHHVIAALSYAFWTQWWPSHKANRLKAHWWIFTPSVTVEALKPIFEMIFGPEEA